MKKALFNNTLPHSHFIEVWRFFNPKHNNLILTEKDCFDIKLLENHLLCTFHTSSIYTVAVFKIRKKKLITNIA